MGWFTSRAGGVIFVHIPKTGGVSIRRWGKRNMKNRCRLLERGEKHKTVYEIRKKYSNYDTSFAVVRNPFDRVISGWKYYQSKEKTQLGLREFIQSPSVVSKQMVEFIDDNTIILRFENLNEEFEFISKLLQEDGANYDKLKMLNITSSNEIKHYREYYDDETRSMVEQQYSDDLKKFNYEF